MATGFKDVFEALAFDAKAVLMVVEVGMEETVAVDVTVIVVVDEGVVLTVLVIVNVRDHVEELVSLIVAEVALVVLALVRVTVMPVDVVVTPGQRLLQL